MSTDANQNFLSLRSFLASISQNPNPSSRYSLGLIQKGETLKMVMLGGDGFGPTEPESNMGLQ